METMLMPVALNEKSYSVTLLQKALEALGLPIDNREAAQGKAGPVTVKTVRALQKRQKVRADRSVLVDEATALAITAALKERGLIATSRSFTVTGAAKLRTGEPEKRRRLIAFDLDLRGVSLYRTIKNIAEIRKNGGFEILGEAVSDNLGNYRITFYDWQYRQAERKKADVVVFALEGENIIGRSRMVNSEDYSDKGLVRDLDVIITREETRTEYEMLMGKLKAFLRESNTTLSDIAKSRDQLVFIAGELDADLSRIHIAANAEQLAREEEKQLSHELLYGIGRQNVRLSWPALYKRREEELRKAVAKSVDERIIRTYQEKEISAFLQTIRQCSAAQLLDDKDADGKNSLNAMLKNALPEKNQRLSFLTALRDFTGSDFREFWKTYLPARPEFKNNPELISGLLLTQQLALLTGNHQALVNELQVKRKISTAHELMDLEKSEWLALLEKTGVPDFIEGKDDEEKRSRYFELTQGLLNAAFPTQRIAKMVQRDELPIEKTKVAKSISAFLSKNEQFDFAGSRIHDFEKEIRAAAGDAYDEVRSELMEIQRVFQVSTSPEAMTVLLENNLHSAYKIACIPRKSFIRTYGDILGGGETAFAIHQRASHINARSEMTAVRALECDPGTTPAYALGMNGHREVRKVLENTLPNYSNLFGSPDICECEHCRSVYSPAAYFVELLRFLQFSGANSQGYTPYDILIGKKDENGQVEIQGRRPDIAHLPLTCENTNTIIPYIDMVNEVMEYYTANSSLAEFTGYDTGEATAEELRANPQNFNLEAYSRLKDAKFPFTLPYHQPLDVIRTYSDHLKVSRYEAMKAMNPRPDAPTARAIEAEALRLSQEEYIILTGETFNGDDVTPEVYEYFGYANAAEFASMQDEPDADGKPKGVTALLSRAGLKYTELVELVKTRFINPYQDTLDFLQKFFSYASIDIDANDLYAKLGQIEAGTLSPIGKAMIENALNAYNSATGASLAFDEFAQWVTDHLGEFRQVITLYEPDSKCSLKTTELRTIQSIYDDSETPGITDPIWSRMHRFIRLWRKLGWTIHETDLVLAALGEDDITSETIYPETISKLESVCLLKADTRRPLNELSVLWGNIDTYGNKSLYKKLFLNRAAQEIDEAFKADAWGDYLQREVDENGPITLAKHQSAILAAFRMTEEDLAAVLQTAVVIDNGNPRAINIDTDTLNLQNLSAIYRYVVLAKALKMRVIDLCKLIRLFNASPFSIWDSQQKKYMNISPADTCEFYKLASSTKTAGFKSSVLDYIFSGILPADSKLGIDKDETLQTAKAIRDAFAAIEQEHPETAESPLTSETLAAKLALTFQPGIVKQFMGLLEFASTCTVFTELNLPIVIPAGLADKYSYTAVSGSLTCKGIMTQDEKNSLDNLSGATDPFKSAVGELYRLSVASILACDITFDAITDQDLDITIPDRLALKYTYKADGRLTCTGVMTDAERDILKGLANVPNFQAAIDKLYGAPEAFINDNFSGPAAATRIFSDLAGAKTTLLDHPAQDPAASLEVKFKYVYKHFLPLLKSKLRKDAITQHIAALIGLSQEATATLISENIDELISKLSVEGFSAAYFNDINWNISVLERNDSTIDFAWGDKAPDSQEPPAVSADNFSVRWKAYIAAPASGEYTLMVEVEEEDEAFKLYLDDTLILEKQAGETNTSWERVVALNSAQMHLLTLEYAEASQNAGIRLRWKTAATAPEIIPASAAYPAAILDAFAEKATVFHQAAMFILGFKISETELNHFINFTDINFMALTAEHWKRVNDYMILRKAVPQAQALLTDIFALASIASPLPTMDDLKQLLHLATAWDEANLEFLVDRFTLGPDDFQNEIALKRIHEVIKIASKTGISAQTMAEWGAAEPDFHKLHNTAQVIKNTVKAKYEEEDWLDLAGNLSNKIRENQKQALIACLLMQPAIRNAGVEDADGLFEYFLIDVQMGACMDTSRIVQANAAIQMFVNRCLLNLESDMSDGSEKGVSPDAIDRDRWEWMKNYRVWEANRKVFLYPENWLEPEWRNDRSEFFKELESYLVQNDITERSVEQGFRDYLMSLNEVSNLEVCGMCQENHEDGKLKYLHVFSRTHNVPYKFYYRRWNEFRKWSAWEKVQVDIRNVEDGDNSGVHLIPVVWKERLFVFWPEFLEKPVPKTQNGTMQEIYENSSTASLEPGKSWEIRLAWSEYVDGKWSPKQVSKEIITVTPDDPEDGISDIAFHAYNRQNNELIVFCGYIEQEGDGSYYCFRLSDIQSKVEGSVTLDGDTFKIAGYKSNFMKKAKSSPLTLKNNTYLQTSKDHKLLYSHHITDFESKLAYPFFYHDSYRTYFVRPVDISVITGIKNPEYIKPFPDIVDDSGYMIPVEIPHVGPDDYMPAEEIAAPYAGATPFYHMAGGMNQTLLPASGSANPNMPDAGSMVVRSADFSGGTGTSVSKNYALEMSHVEEAFGAGKEGGYSLSWRLDKGLEFHTFSHPYSSKFVTRLNQGGLQALMGSDTENPLAEDAIKSDEGATFVDAYDPVFTHGLVQKPEDFAKIQKTYYKKNVCFDPLGANSLYNWELFFHAPLYIATRLSKNGKYEEAMKWFHYIFDPTTDEMPGAGESEISRYWKVLPFKVPPAVTLEELFTELNNETDKTSQGYNPDSDYFRIVSAWRKNPFDPHLVASDRPLAYMKHVVIKYVENLVAWGDSLFRQFTRESVNEALQIYVIANHILGPRPQFVPKRGEIKAESYDSLKEKWDDFSNALVELENIFPYSSDVSVDPASSGTHVLGIGSALYFCIPSNEKLLEYWDTVADRLFKIRHCMDIDGVERKLALFAPPIDPAALIQAVSQGLSLGSILADLSSPPPIYRFSYLLQKANEFCSDVKALGSALLAALEKKDAEELGRLRTSHETSMLELVTSIKERQVLDAKVNKENLLKARETAGFRLQHYIDLLGNESVTVPAPPTIAATLTADSQLPADTGIPTIETDVDESLVDSDESGVKLIKRESEELEQSRIASDFEDQANMTETIAKTTFLIPDFEINAEPFGTGSTTVTGGTPAGLGISALASGFRALSAMNQYDAQRAGKLAGFIRREQDWTLQANLAAKEIIQLDKQITSADIRIQVAEKELENHKKQIENSREVELFLKDKFTNQELYQWMKEQLFAVYKLSYNLAFDMAKKAEKAYKYEMGTETASFIQYGYWDNSKQGLVSGEKLQLALRQMEKSYLEKNRRELELSKSVSLALLNPLALIQLRETGKCYVSLPEELFDLDFPGHYFRRIKSVSISIPCVAGPYTTVNCSLRLLNNHTRINTSMNSEENYEHENDEGLWIDDGRFRTSNVPVTSIAASTGQNDAGMFEFNFRDERYLPFEGAGAVSDWQIELSTKKELRQFDYATISDVILHLKYTARENGGLFKDSAADYIKRFLKNDAELSDQPLMRMFSMKHEFTTEWHKFLHPATAGGEQVLKFTIGKERFPFFAQARDIVAMKIEVFAKCTQPEDYHMILSYTSFEEELVTSPAEPPDLIIMPRNSSYGGLNKATINVNDAGLNLEELDVKKEMSLKVRYHAAPDYTSLGTGPDEVEDIFLVMHYKLEDPEGN
jgi:hypothetical protein